MSAIVTKVVTYIVTAVLIAVLSFFARRDRNRDKAHPERWRLPRVVGFLSWLIVAFGVIMVLSAILSEPSPYDDSDDTGLLVSGVFVLALGVFCLFLYRNWWVDFGDDVIDFQTLTGKRKAIRYADIVSYEVTDSNGMPMITIKSADRTKLTLNPRFVDATPLTARAEFAHAFGYWPSDQEFAWYTAGGHPGSMPSEHPGVFDAGARGNHVDQVEQLQDSPSAAFGPWATPGQESTGAWPAETPDSRAPYGHAGSHGGNGEYGQPSRYGYVRPDEYDRPDQYGYSRADHYGQSSYTGVGPGEGTGPSKPAQPEPPVSSSGQRGLGSDRDVSSPFSQPMRRSRRRHNGPVDGR